jgi:beta-lactamase class A
MGDRVGRLERYEPDLGPMLCADLGDATPPEAMADLVRGITTGDLLLPASRDRLLQWMRATRTGAHRLRAAPAGTPARRQQGRHRTRRGNHQQVQGHRDHLPARQGPDRDRRPP